MIAVRPLGAEGGFHSAESIPLQTEDRFNPVNVGSGCLIGQRPRDPWALPVDSPTTLKCKPRYPRGRSLTGRFRPYPGKELRDCRCTWMTGSVRFLLPESLDATVRCWPG
jgi:hypothetical protein